MKLREASRAKGKAVRGTERDGKYTTIMQEREGICNRHPRAQPESEVRVENEKSSRKDFKVKQGK